MAPGGAAATGTKGPRQATGSKKEFIQLASFLPVQFSNNPPLALPFFFFFFFFSLALSPFLPLLLSCKPLENKRVHKKGTEEEEMSGKMNSILFYF
jgi:hypothetical protein